MLNGRADLHLHTTASDGSWTPRQLVNAARTAGLTTIAVTDHDTTAGIAEAVEAGNEIGIRVIPGVELSVSVSEGDIHLLAYFIDPNNAPLQQALNRMQHGRRQRVGEIVAVLQRLGYHITVAEVNELVGDGVGGRPHVARVLVEKEYVPDVSAAFRQLLAEGKPAYIPRPKLSPQEGIRLIHGAGGVAVCAHPKLLPQPHLISELVAWGVDGIEVVHSTHTLPDQRHYEQFATAHDLLTTGGSDCHGPGVKKEMYIGRYFIPLRWATQLEQRHKKIKRHNDA